MVNKNYNFDILPITTNIDPEFKAYAAWKFSCEKCGNKGYILEFLKIKPICICSTCFDDDGKSVKFKLVGPITMVTMYERNL